MQLERNGNELIIEEVKFLKGGIKIMIDGEALRLHESTYSHFYLYKGKKLSHEELKEILDFQDNVKSRDYAIKLLTTGLYSEKEIRDKLAKRKIAKQKIDELIDDLKLNHYIDDQRFLEEYLEVLERKNTGKLKIIQSLEELGIDKLKIQDIVFLDDDELDKAKMHASKYLAHHKNQNYIQLKQGLYQYLLRNGFESEIASRVIDKTIKEVDVDEKELLKKIKEKYITSHHLDLSIQADYQKALGYLVRKGYKYEDVIDVLRRS